MSPMASFLSFPVLALLAFILCGSTIWLFTRTVRTPLKNRNVVISISSNGIGLAMAQHDVEEGADVMIIGGSLKELDWLCLSYLVAETSKNQPPLTRIITRLTAMKVSEVADKAFAGINSGSFLIHCGIHGFILSIAARCIYPRESKFM
ncbi:hypothetical protein LINPERHAP1_LOCUS37443 [Linum perenne]